MSELSPIEKIDFWFKGEAQTFYWIIYQSDNRTLQNISGWTLQFKMSNTAGSTAIITKTVNVDDGPNGISRVAFTAAETVTLTAMKYFYTLSRTDVGSEQVLAHGDAFLQARIP